jgi:hypothetical protein
MAGQDYTKRLSAGGIQPVNIAGDYIFCKAADRPFSVIMDGSRTTMAAGDKYRPGAFKEFEIENTDPENPIFIVLTIGQGDYNRQIVQGEIMVEPGLRRADGTFAADTRYSLEIDLSPSNLTVTSYLEGDTILNKAADSSNSQPRMINAGPDGSIVTFRYTYTGANVSGIAFDFRNKETLDVLETYTHNDVISVDDVCFWPGVGLVFLDNDGLYIITAAGAVTLIKSFSTPGSSTINSIAYDFVTGKLLVYRRYQSPGLYAGIFFVDRDLTHTFTELFRANNRIRVDQESGQYVFMLFSQLIFIDRVTFEQISVANHPINYYETGGFISGIETVARGNASDTTLHKVATFDFTTKPEFIAVRPGCGLKTALIKPGAVPQVSADITAISYLNGIELSGELIKAALEFYFRRKVEAGYLDHIYSIDFGRDGNGNTFKPINTGNQTFDRANVADSFITLLPGKITMTIDNELTLGGAL